MRVHIRHAHSVSEFHTVFRYIIMPAKIFAFLNLLFFPAFAILIGVAFLSGDRWWFSALGLPALLINFTVLILNPARRMILSKISSIARGSGHGRRGTAPAKG